MEIITTLTEFVSGWMDIVTSVHRFVPNSRGINSRRIASHTPKFVPLPINRVPLDCRSGYDSTLMAYESGWMRGESRWLTPDSKTMDCKSGGRAFESGWMMGMTGWMGGESERMRAKATTIAQSTAYPSAQRKRKAFQIRRFGRMRSL